MGKPGSIDDIRPFAELALNATTAVYKAYQTSLERFVLLKRLRPAYSRDEDLAARFQEEARIAARVQHPNVVSIYAFGHDDEGAYIVAEFVDGLDLGKVVERSRVPPDVALYILAESARGLKAAHDKDVLHRDLKPSNILISREGEVKLSDFGLASVSSSADGSVSEIRGTLAYLAPEQILENAVDARSDLFSLGATFFEMLTGRRAFPGSDSQEIFDAILNRDPSPYLAATAGVDDEIETICARLLSREAADRYPNAGAVVRAAASCLRARGAKVDAAVLSAFLEDPESVDWPRAKVSVPSVIVVPESAEAEKTSDRGLWRSVAVVAAVLFFAAALVYAGVSMLGPSSDPQPADRLAEGSATDTAIGDDTTAVAAGLETVPTDETAEIDTPVAPVEVPPAVGEGAPQTEEPAGVQDDTAAGQAEAEGETAIEEDVTEEPPLPGYVLVSVDTSAWVLVDGDTLARTTPGAPLVASLAPGEHALSLRNAAFPKEDRVVNVLSGDTTSIHHELYSTVGRLRLQVSPWAYVYIDGDSQPVAQTPIRQPLIVLPGLHEIRLRNPDAGIDTTTTVVIPKGEIVTRKFILSGVQ